MNSFPLLTFIHQISFALWSHGWTKILLTEISITDYVSLRLDRDRHGGVLIYLKSSFCFSALPNPTSGIELLTIVVQHDILPARICLSVFYRPPSSGPESLDAVCDYFNSINSAQFTNFVLIGDFNVDVSTCSHPLFHKLNSLASTYCLSQMVTQHTHIHHNGSRSTIDLLFVSNPNLVKDCCTIPPLANSDHLRLQIQLCQKSPKSVFKRCTVWRYKFADWDRACELIDSTDWSSLMDAGDINRSWTNWRNRFTQIMYECIPSSTVPPRRNRPWLTKSLIQAIRRRNALFKRAKISGDYTAYKRYRNKVVNYLRNAKFAFFRKLNPRKSKGFWRICKLLNKSVSSIPTLTTSSSTAHTDLQKAELLNSFFVSCFNRSHPPLDEVGHQLQPCFGETPNSLLCTEDAVFDLLATLDTSKSSGPDDISAPMLKYTAASITPPITRLFNQSLQEGKIPSDWKISHVVPIPKVSPAKSPDNYRPISLLSILSKVLERHVYSLIAAHLDLVCHLSDSQWGFRAGRSTVSALLSTTSHWFTLLEAGLEVCAIMIFFDYRKAFDSVPHRPLLGKLISLNINRLWAIDANWRHIRNVRYRRLTPNGVKAVFFAFFVHSARLLRSTSGLWLAADRRY